MIDGYLRRLERELAERGVRGGTARRVLAEARDHLLELEENHGTIERFGTSEQVAMEIAAQLATTRTIRSTYRAFGALAVAWTSPRFEQEPGRQAEIRLLGPVSLASASTQKLSKSAPPLA